MTDAQMLVKFLNWHRKTKASEGAEPTPMDCWLAGREAMRAECLDVIDEVSDISCKQDAELTRAIKKLP